MCQFSSNFFCGDENMLNRDPNQNWITIPVSLSKWQSMSKKYLSTESVHNKTPIFLSEMVLWDRTIGSKHLLQGRAAAWIPSTPPGSDRASQPPTPCTTVSSQPSNSPHQPNLSQAYAPGGEETDRTWPAPSLPRPGRRVRPRRGASRPRRASSSGVIPPWPAPARARRRGARPGGTSQPPPPSLLLAAAAAAAALSA